jgi:uncharacterized repeat protein (TIGR01451 family)
MKKNYFLFVLFFLTIISAFAQTPVCGGTFTDPAGPSTNYANNSDYTVTIYPTTPGEFVKVSFTSFATEASWDGLYVFNGNSTAAPQISSGNSAGSVPGGLPGAFWGTTIPGPFISTSPDGSLTFRFRSDSSMSYAGWVANVTCQAVFCSTPANFSSTDITTTSATLHWNASASVSQWEVMALPPGSPAPNASQSGALTATNSFTAIGLACATNYRAYVRSVCSPSDQSMWTGPFSFQTLSCVQQPASSCTGGNSLCNAFGTVFPNTTGTASQGSMGCLSLTPNAVWFNFTTEMSGTVNLQIVQNSNFDANANPTGTAIDADYILYGPYTDPITSCSAQLTADKIVSCSYSAAAVENPSFTTTQPGAYYYLMVTNFSNTPGFIKISQTGGMGTFNCKGFRLNAFLDNNTNGIKDSGDTPFPHGQFVHEKNNDGNIHNTVSSTGVVNIIDGNPINTYDFAFQIDTQYTPYFTLTTPSFNDMSITGTGMTNVNFPVLASSTYNDLAVNIAPMGQPRPGFTYKNKIIYTNNGNQTINGTLTFTKDGALSISNISQAGTVATANGFTYDFVNLLPFETRTIEVTMQVPTIPTVQLGHLLTNTVAATILTGSDAIITNNNFAFTQEIVGSYDPNDITESHGKEIVHSTFASNDYLYYTIQFENTGTASAINVRVNDLLDTKLDETSIKMVNSSHNYVMDRVGRTINWEFKNVMLLATSQNPNTSKGYIVYKIKPKPGYAVGDIIPSTASIFFDFNPAIVTTTFNTEFVSQLGITEFENAEFIFYPNPAKDFVTVSVKNNQEQISNVTVYDISGKIVLNKSLSALSTSEMIDLSQIAKGMYLIEVSTKSNLKTIKKLIVE